MPSPYWFRFGARSLTYRFFLFIFVLIYLPPVGAEPEPYNGGWEFYFDNDVLALPNIYTDQDYTAGVAVSLIGRRATEYSISLDGVRNKFDHLLGHSKLYKSNNTIDQHSMEFGLASFTPRNLASVSPILDDRPYASLVFLANSFKTTIPEKRVSFHSSFMVGLLGLRVSEVLQNSIHNMIGIDAANGWGNQISDGGELTAKYSFARQKNRAHKHIRHGRSYEVNTTVGGNIGYITEFGVGAFARFGKIQSPWWNFNPYQTESIHIGAPIAGMSKESDATERYLWAGINLKYRVYNSLLQGQFNKSTVTFSSAQMNPLILEAWIGLVRSFGKAYRVNFTVRTNTPELNVGEKRAPVWTSFTISKSI